MLLVEHDLDLVLEVSDRLYVLDFGKMLTSGTPDDVMANSSFRKAYLGANA